MGTKVFSSQTLSMPCYKTGKDELAVLPRHTKVVERYLVFFSVIYIHGDDNISVLLSCGVNCEVLCWNFTLISKVVSSSIFKQLCWA